MPGKTKSQVRSYSDNKLFSASQKMFSVCQNQIKSPRSGGNHGQASRCNPCIRFTLSMERRAILSHLRLPGTLD